MFVHLLSLETDGSRKLDESISSPPPQTPTAAATTATAATEAIPKYQQIAPVSGC